MNVIIDLYHTVGLNLSCLVCVSADATVRDVMKLANADYLSKLDEFQDADHGFMPNNLLEGLPTASFGDRTVLLPMGAEAGKVLPLCEEYAPETYAMGIVYTWSEMKEYVLRARLMILMTDSYCSLGFS